MQGFVVAEVSNVQPAGQKRATKGSDLVRTQRFLLNKMHCRRCRWFRPRKLVGKGQRSSDENSCQCVISDSVVTLRHVIKMF